MIAQIIGKQLSVRDNTQLVQGTVGEKLYVKISNDWCDLARAIFVFLFLFK